MLADPKPSTSRQGARSRAPREKSAIRLLLPLLLLAWSASPGVARAADKNGSGQWIIVTAPAFNDVVTPLCELRKNQGYAVKRIEWSASAGKGQDQLEATQRLTDRLRKISRAFDGATLVLIVGTVGGDPEGGSDGFVVPASRGSVARMMGQPTDNPYSDPDKKLLARIAVGRFPARSVAEAKGMVAKTIAWEHNRRPGRWKRRVTVLAGVPNYNPLVDRMVETFAVSQFARLGPDWTGRAIYRSETSPFTLPEGELQPRAVAYLSEAHVLSVYLGHSLAGGFWSGYFQTSDGRRWRSLFSRDDWAGLQMKHVNGIFASFGCNACQLGGDGGALVETPARSGEGYGIYAIRNPRGPVAVIGAHDATAAAMSLLMSKGLLEAVPDADESPTLGEVWLATKTHLARGPISPLLYRALDEVDGDPGTPQAVQRREHQEMFMLLGDPAIRFPAMEKGVTLKVAEEVTAGGKVVIRGTVPERLANAQGEITLERKLTSTAARLSPLPAKDEAQARRDIMLDNHGRANAFVLSAVKVFVKGRSFSAEIEVPRELVYSELLLRASFANKSCDGMATVRIAVVAE